MEMRNEVPDDDQVFAADDNGGNAGAGDDSRSPEQVNADRALVKDVIARIKADRRHHEKAFRRMRDDMYAAMWGADRDWSDKNYRANILGRHVKQKAAQLYAKNPKVSARRRPRLDFAVWDESPASLEVAMNTIQMAQAAAQGGVDPVTGAPAELPPGFEQAQATIADFQQGTERRRMLDRVGKTMEILFQHAMDEQKPLTFKRAMKALVRRTCTTGVGYVELGIHREVGESPEITAQLTDARARLAHLDQLAQDAVDGEQEADAKERAELELTIAALEKEPNIILSEGLTIDFPLSTQVIPDQLCKSLEGFIGSEHITIEYTYSVERVKELFGVDLGQNYVGYRYNSGRTRTYSENDVLDDDYEWRPGDKGKSTLACVWKHYDKTTGLVYYVADGYPDFLKPPAAPDVFVESFWPVYALTFNAVESEEELFPPSDVFLLRDMQREHNRSRQGKREHRDAARPRWVFANGAFGSEEDPLVIKNLKPFQAAGLNIDPSTEIAKVLQSLPVPGVDPNLYDTGEVRSDMQLVAGAQEALMGGIAKATATETAVAANASNSSDGSSIDDLDGFLTTIAREAGQIMLREYSQEYVMEIAGPGAVWPEMDVAEASREIYLEVEAGSTGKPNQAVEINNWKMLLPLLQMMPNIDPIWMAKETIKRLDDRADPSEAIAEGVMSIVAQNTAVSAGPAAQPPAGDPGKSPESQGARGAQNTQAPPGGEGGSDPAFGTNQVPNQL